MVVPRLVASTISGIMLFLAIPAITEAATPADSATAHQIFEGIFFQHGPLANRIPTEVQGTRIRALTPPKWDAKTQKAAHQLEADIAKNDPRFFASFASDVTSGDPGLVKIAMERTVADVKIAADQERVALPKTAKREVALVAPPASVQSLIYVSQAMGVVAVTVAGLVYIAATLYIVAAEVLIAILVADDTDDGGDGFASSDFVTDSLTARLADNFSNLHVSGI